MADDNTTILLAKSVGDEELHKIKKSALLHHTLIVGQSGSGKSYFLSRLIEEILLRTSARALLIDPNGDYRRFGMPSEEVWTDEKFEQKFSLFSNEAKNAEVHDFDEKRNFIDAWKQIQHLTLLANMDDEPSATKDDGSENQRLFLNWTELQEEEQISALDEMSLSVEAMYFFQALVSRLGQKGTALEELVDSLGRFNPEAPRAGEMDQDIVYEAGRVQRQHRQELTYKLKNFQKRHTAIMLHSALNGTKESPAPLSLHHHLGGPLRQMSSGDHAQTTWRNLALVLDRADPNSMLQVVDVTLSKLWRDARTSALMSIDGSRKNTLPRVPTFIVIDEAQNFLPNEPKGPLQLRVAERIYQIASEGRKYGLYLILVSQRPSKLHTGIVPECENSAILRLQSPEEIEFARLKLGTDTVLSGSLPRFKQGRAVIHGQWSLNAQDVTVAPARTILGGSGIGDTWLKSQIDVTMEDSAND